jgi:hypothetical protein
MNAMILAVKLSVTACNCGRNCSCASVNTDGTCFIAVTHLAGDAIVLKKQSCTAILVPRRADVLQLAIGSWLNVSRARRMGPRKCRS